MTQLNHQLVNTHYIDRLGNVAYAVGKLTDLDVCILDIDMNRVKPVLTVQNCAAVRSLDGVRFSHRGSPQGRVTRMQAQLNNCRIEWEVQP